MFKRTIVLTLVMMLLLPVAFAQTFDFPGKFTEGKVVIEPMKYQSANLSIEITKGRQYDSDYYVADIHIKDLSSFRHGFPRGKWNSGVRKLSLMAKDAGAILAITGDYAKTLNVGIVVADGKVIRQEPNNLRDLCIIYTDGSMDVMPGKGVTMKTLTKEKEVWQTMLFGPNLLENDGSVLQTTNSKIKGKNPRTAVGYISPGHYVFVVVDGRTRGNRGMSMLELSQLMHDLQCEKAYNLDGGQSAAMWFHGSLINEPYHGGRQLADIFYIAEP